MVKLHKLHKLSGLAAGAVLLLLAVTGFFLDHDKWQFLYSTKISYTPKSLQEQEKRLFEGYYIDPKNSSHKIACGKRGVFESFDGGRSFKKSLNRICLGLREDGNSLFAATNDGIYLKKDGEWELFALKGLYVNAISLYKDRVAAAVDKRVIYLIDKSGGEIVKSATIELNPKDIGKPVTLSRLVRDLHYGRGYVDSELSLWINDYGAILLAWLSLSGFLIWWRITKKRGAKKTRGLIKTHSNIFTIAAIFPLTVLAITGIFLDHAKVLGPFMKSVTVPSYLLPPVYRGLSHDIWSVDFDGKLYRLGNRYGVFASEDLKKWRLESRGFAYRMFRKGERLFVSGMGAPNRIYENGKWRILKNSPHMFRDIIETKEGTIFFSFHAPKEPLPEFKTATLYSLLMALHDGTLFASWWIWVNDAAALLLLLLMSTGMVRWWMKRRSKGPLFKKKQRR